MSGREESSLLIAREFSLLIVDQDRSFRDAVSIEAERSGFAVFCLDTAADLLRQLSIHNIDLVLLDAHAAGSDGHMLLCAIKRQHPDTAVIMMSAEATVDAVLAAMKGGATDYLRKPFEPLVLAPIFEREIRSRSAVHAEMGVYDAWRNDPAYLGLLGQSLEIQKIVRLLPRLASSTHPVLIVGERGTGKRRLARAIHDSGTFRARPFIAVDCAFPSPAFLESELLRQINPPGAAARDGENPGGTLFLDEIGHLPLHLQAQLLARLEAREISRLGMKANGAFEWRIIAATSQELQPVIESGGFQRDLYFRLHGVILRLPPLRARKADIPLLAAAILRRLPAGNNIAYNLTADAMKLLLDYSWPHNLRELEQCLEGATSRSQGPVLAAPHLALQGKPPGPPAGNNLALGDGRIIPLAEVEKHTILRTLEQLNGDKQMAAKLLGIGKTTLYRKLREWNAPDTERQKSA